MKSIRWSIISWSGGLLLILITVLTVNSVVIQRSEAITSAENRVRSEANSSAASIDAALEVALDTARALAQAFGAVKENGMALERDVVNAMLKNVLEQNPSFLGVYTAWEPDAFDGNDSQYANREGYDETGRFIPYWVRSGGVISMVPLVDYEVEGIGDYYLLPKKTKNEVIIDPYLYPIDGVDVLLTSLVVPIVVDGQFLGMVGVDYPLDFLQAQADQFDFYDGAGILTIYSNNGTIGGMTGNSELVGSNMADVSGAGYENYLSAVKNGEETVEIYQGQNGIYVPIFVGSTSTPWSVNVDVPSEKITAAADANMWRMIGLTALLSTIAYGAFWMILGKIINPMKTLTQAANVLASGKMSWDIDEKQKKGIYKRRDEIGAMAKALDTTVNFMLEKIFWYEALLDSIPLMISVTDPDMNWTFINKALEDYIGVKREAVLGKHCSNWNTSICDTLDCAIARLRKGLTTTLFNQNGSDLKADGYYLYDRAGEKVGQIEVVQDISKDTETMHFQEKAVDQLADYLEQMSQGVLDFEMQELQAANDNTVDVHAIFTTIMESLKQARDMLSQTIKAVVMNAKNVGNASEQLAQIASQAGSATSQIATTIQQVAKGTSQQTESVNRTAIVMENVNNIVSGVAKGTQDQAAAVERASLVTEKITAADGISARVGMAAHQVQEMGIRSEEIGAIIETIEDIASQTNLLALNAAIEAARAGEHGKGFAVVADEVRKLAERSSNSTKEIAALVSGIQQAVAEAVKMTNTAANEINMVSEELVSAIDSVSSVVAENRRASDTLKESSNEVMQSVENIASISEENSAAVEEVSAASEEMSAQVEEVAASANDMADMAKELSNMVARFKVK